MVNGATELAEETPNPEEFSSETPGEQKQPEKSAEGAQVRDPVVLAIGEGALTNREEPGVQDKVLVPAGNAEPDVLGAASPPVLVPDSVFYAV